MKLSDAEGILHVTELGMTLPASEKRIPESVAPDSGSPPQAANKIAIARNIAKPKSVFIVRSPFLKTRIPRPEPSVKFHFSHRVSSDKKALF